jgi:hypothetical protein
MQIYHLPELPVLNISLLKTLDNINMYYPRQIIEVLVDQEGYTHLGWLNDGVNPPGLNDWMTQYRNQSGSYTIMVSHGSKLIYCVDMGD